MLQKSKITKRWYTVETLSDFDKIALGFMEKVKPVKKSKSKRSDDKTSKPDLKEESGL